VSASMRAVALDGDGFGAVRWPRPWPARGEPSAAAKSPACDQSTSVSAGRTAFRFRRHVLHIPVLDGGPMELRARGAKELSELGSVAGQWFKTATVSTRSSVRLFQKSSHSCFK